VRRRSIARNTAFTMLSAAALIVPSIAGRAADEAPAASVQFGGGHFGEVGPEAGARRGPVLDENVLDPSAGMPPAVDAAARHRAISLEGEHLAFQQGGYALRAGKLTPHFGIAWDEAPGFYGSDFAKGGYRLAGRVGVGGWAGTGSRRAPSCATRRPPSASSRRRS